MAVRLQPRHPRLTRRSAALAAIGLLSGCITPTIVRAADADGAIPLDTFPPGTELVELPVGKGGAVLRGVFVPAGPGARVVLHFQEACTTISYGGLFVSQSQIGQGLPAVWDLRGLGFASLVLDYRGVGISTGERDNANLPVDTAAAFAEATRRAGGDPGRVIVRGNSLGTLAAATLLETGARPGAVVLIAPVRAETVGANFLRFLLWDAVAVPLGWLVGSAMDVSLDRVVARGGIPLAVIAPFQDRDCFLGKSELIGLQRAVEQGKGRWMPDYENHNEMSKGACSLTENERKFYLELYPEDPHAAERAAALRAALPPSSAVRSPRGRAFIEMLSHYVWLADPRLAEALAGCHVPIQPLVAWVPWLERNRGQATLPDDGWQRILDLEDNEERDLTTVIIEVAIPLSGVPASRRPEVLAAWLADFVAAQDKTAYMRGLRDERRVIEELVCAACCRFLDRAIKLPLDTRIEWLMRALLKAAAIPDRVQTLRDGTRIVEAWYGDGWRRVSVPRARSEWQTVGDERLTRFMPVRWPGFSIPLTASTALLRSALPDWLRQRLDADVDATKRVEHWVQKQFALLQWPKAIAFLALGHRRSATPQSLPSLADEDVHAQPGTEDHVPYLFHIGSTLERALDVVTPPAEASGNGR